MSEQHYVRVEPGTPREKGDVRWCYQTCKLLPVYQHIGKHVYTNDFVLRPVDPPPVNPWVNDRKPEGSDAWRNLVEIWRNCFPYRIHYRDVKHGETWRRIDQTPPPAEPTEAELVDELLLSLDENMTFWLGKAYPSAKIKEKVAAIRAKQESEGRDV